jgi:NAD-dependent deacetylase
MNKILEINLHRAATLIRETQSCIAFTGAGISVESGVPPFRGNDGIWAKYNPSYLNLNFFYYNPKKSWEVIREIFYDHLSDSAPNQAHVVLAQLEQAGYLQAVITQNIDNLHQEAGSKRVYEYHGSTRFLRCIRCHSKFLATLFDFSQLPPSCKQCGNILKPDFIFFGESIPEDIHRVSIQLVESTEILLVIGTTAEVTPAALLPRQAKARGAVIIEINIAPSSLTDAITDIFLPGKASEIMLRLAKLILT